MVIINLIRVRKYLEYMHEEEKLAQRGQNSLNKLSKNLKEEIMQESYLKFLKNIKIFKKFSNEFLISLTNVVTEYTFAPDDLICRVNKINIKKNKK